jgi:nucleotide sugar dehydrogenase
MNVAVVGLGKIGLPLAVQVASAGHDVRGFDVSRRAVDVVNEGDAPFPGEPELDVRLRAELSAGRFHATTEADAAIGGADVVIVVVPLVVGADRRPEFAMLDAATDAVARSLRSGALVSYETTLPVGTTRSRFAPRLAEVSGFAPGRELFVCHSPERVSSGSVFRDLARYPKLVGGIDPESTRRAAAFYRSCLTFDARPDLPRPNGVWELADTDTAELAKLAETTYRDVNIAFANELAVAAEAVGADILTVIEACNSQPYSHIHRPGIAVGGHCIPVYPHLLMSTIDGLRLPALARAVNDEMPRHAVGRLEAAVGDLAGATAVVLGLAFRGGVKEDAFSGAYPLARELAAAGANPVVHDPLFTDDELRAKGFTPYRLGQPCDVAVVQADHPDYSSLSAADLPGIKAIYDGRNILDVERWAGTPIVRLGVPDG